ncbi:MAG: AarF/ABC1/UbiB kinase family protein [Cyanobacteria bacterium P01_D01_bin.128]
MTSSHPQSSYDASAQRTVTVASKPVAAESRVSARSPQGRRSSVVENPVDLLVYDPEAINAFYDAKPLRVFQRFLSIFWPLLSFLVSVWLSNRLGKVSPAKEQRQAVRMRQILTRLGPAYIKVGQALSTRPDLVPPVYLNEFTQLQDQLPAFANATAYRFIEEELGAAPADLYAELSTKPVAAASLGQVYRGRLKSGEEVAVKVQRPGLAQQITLDIYILRQIAQLANRFVPQIRSDLVGIMDEFGARIFEEMDYTHEAENARRFAHLYGHLRDIYVPHIYTQYTGQRVLTMEWIEGTKLTKIDELEQQGIDASYLIEVGVQCSLRQLLEHGFFHADPHPGNLLATPDGKLAYLDFGMMSEVKPYQRYGLIEAIVHMVNRDFDGLAQDYIKLEFLTPETDLRPIIPALANVFNNALGASVAELNFKSITDEFSSLMYEYPFRVPAYYALIIRSLVTLEGIAINVDPDFKVLSKAYPYVSKRLLSDSSPELRASLKDLLFKDGRFRWNRLENLLRNAKDSEDYDLSRVLDQTLDFLFSERGEFIRIGIANEIVKQVDVFGRNLASNFTKVLQGPFNLESQAAATDSDVQSQEQQDFSHFMHILTILRETDSFDPTQLLSVLPRVLFRAETLEMGQQIVGGLAQRAAARFIREFLLAEEVNDAESPINGATDHRGEESRSLLPAGATQ